MSLVAYGASDDSETSEVEEAETLQATKLVYDTNLHDRGSIDDGKISDEEDDYYKLGVVSANSEVPKATSSTNNKSDGLLRVPAPTVLSDLPAPKAVSSSQDNRSKDGEDELEEEVKPKASQVADAPKPPPKKVRQPIRIVLPALEQDCDEEEDGSEKKPKQPAAKAGSSSSLFSLLPPPVHGSKKQANRPLIPYSLTKRQTPSKSKESVRKIATSPDTSTSSKAAAAGFLPSQKCKSAFNALTGYESDSDEEDANFSAGTSNFFSIGTEADEASNSSRLPVMKNCAPSVSQEEDVNNRTSDRSIGNNKDGVNIQPSSTLSESPVSSYVSTVMTADSAGETAKHTVDSLTGYDDKDDGGNEVSSTVKASELKPDTPLNFSSTIQGCGWSATPLTSPMLPEMYAASSNNTAASYWQRQQHYAQDFSGEVEEKASCSSGSNVQQYMEDEQFLRLSGKRKRGQEDIQIIDASVDDYVDPNELMKGITEESSYQPHRKKDNMPSSQQKRKKQITYLAFQAKERELELKNAWSQNRMTKNQARSKYGF